MSDSLFIRWLDVLLPRGDDPERYEIAFGGRTAEFFEALEMLKKDISPDERSFDEETKRWTIKVTNHNTVALEAIFPHFQMELRSLKNQTSLW